MFGTLRSRSRRFLSRPGRWPGRLLAGLALGWTAGGLWLLLVGLTACRPPADAQAESDAAVALALRLPSRARDQTSAACRECHPDHFAAWRGTDHALANQDITEAAVDLHAAFSPAREAADGGSRLRVELLAGGPHVTVTDADGRAGEALRVAGVLGHRPARQMLVETEPGRLQPTDLAWDPALNEWFNVFGEEDRRPGEWGHWTGRGMNWNSMCAHCHMTGYRKNYDAGADRYHSSWVEHGVGCIQCHGPVPAGHAGARETAAYATPDTHWIRDRSVSQQTCAYCHARNEPLTAEFSPGETYEDHFRLTLPVEEGVFWPDGQQRAEDFNWTSVKLSRMHHAGVTCMDCHDPHTTGTLLPVENNALCMQCHSAPGRVMPTTGVRARVIDPVAHSRHRSDSAGHQCVSCHMPTTTYMMRSPRHDHGWLKPDPLLTKELGIPNACNGCHQDRSVDWAIEHAVAWYGDKLESRQRSRARTVAAAQRGEEGAVTGLLELLADEDIPAWRATYLQLLTGRGTQDPRVEAAARTALASTDALERSSAVQVLTGVSGAEADLRSRLTDPVRLVRLDAAWALPEEAAQLPGLAKEQREYLELDWDQPGGRVRMGQYLANLGRLGEAAEQMQTAARWDRYAAGIHEQHGRVLRAAGRLSEAAAAYYRAAQTSPGDGEAMFRAGLAYAEAGQAAEAENALRAAVDRQPELHRAWYNLGLLQSARGAVAEALASLGEAERLAPEQPDYPYAAGTVYWQSGDREAARAAARRALAADPGYAPARALLR